MSENRREREREREKLVWAPYKAKCWALQGQQMFDVVIIEIAQRAISGRPTIIFHYYFYLILSSRTSGKR